MDGDSETIRRAFACSAELAGHILGRGRVRAFPARTTLVRRGDSSAFTFLLIVGRAQALLYGFDGQTVLLHEFAPGDLFGALGDLDPVPQEADVVAVEAVRSFLLEAAELVALAERHGAIGLALSRLLHRRLRQATERVYAQAAMSAAGRVCAELLRLARGSADLTIRPAPVISELALRVGTTRETASRTVSGLERRGIIRRDPGALVVVAPRQLEEAAL